MKKKICHYIFTLEIMLVFSIFFPYIFYFRNILLEQSFQYAVNYIDIMFMSGIIVGVFSFVLFCFLINAEINVKIADFVDYINETNLSESDKNLKNIDESLREAYGIVNEIKNNYFKLLGSSSQNESFIKGEHDKKLNKLTEELNQKISDFEKLRKLSADREIKMMDLRLKAKHLEEELFKLKNENTSNKITNNESQNSKDVNL